MHAPAAGPVTDIGGLLACCLKVRVLLAWDPSHTGNRPLAEGPHIKLMGHTHRKQHLKLSHTPPRVQSSEENYYTPLSCPTSALCIDFQPTLITPMSLHRPCFRRYPGCSLTHDKLI